MKKVKIIEIWSNDCYECGGQNYYDGTDWDEVTDEELELLKEWAINYVDKRDHRLHYAIATPHESSPKKVVADYINELKIIDEQYQAQQKIKYEAKKKREALKAEKQKQKELKLIEELKKKHHL